MNTSHTAREQAAGGQAAGEQAAGEQAAGEQAAGEYTAGEPAAGERVRAVCVFCASSTDIDERYLGLATEVGQELGRRRLTLVSGAGSISAMGALARAARVAGSHTVGVIPQALTTYEVVDTDADELIVTADMRERKARMDDRSDAFLVLPGGIGTMEEFFEAWVGLVLGMHRKPVVLLDPWDDYEMLHQLIAGMVHRRFVRPEVAGALIWTKTAADALDRIEAWWHRAPTVDPPGFREAVIGLEAD